MSHKPYSRIMTALERPILLLVTVFSTLRRWMLGRHAIGIVYESENGTLISGVGDMFVGGNLGFRGRYEVAMLNSLLALVGPESRVLVLGTHIGALAIPLAQKVREVVAYEANPETFRFLQYNLKLNKIDNLSPFNLAAGDRHGKIEFFTSGVNSGGSGRSFDRSPALQLERLNRIEVEMVRLSDHITDPRFDLVLMDIEGSEYFALQGMGPILASCSYLQFEYLPTVVSGSGVSDEDFVAVLGDFAELRVQGTDISANRGEFLDFFRQLRRDHQRVDVLAIAQAPASPLPARSFKLMLGKQD
jgi:FkbM family methyltransferase